MEITSAIAAATTTAPGTTPPLQVPTDGFALRLADAIATQFTVADGAHGTPDAHGVAHVHGEAHVDGHAHTPAFDGTSHAAVGATTLGAMLRAGTPTSGATTLGGMVAAGVTAGTAPAAVAAPVAEAAAAAPALVAPVDGATAVDGPFAGRVVVSATEGRRSSDYGPRVHPITGARRLHAGVDTAAPTGTPVRSVTDGVVVAAGERGGYGLTVDVDHGGGVTTRYAHLSRIDVRVGDRLGVGHELGAVGSTGRSTGPHLHLEVRVDGEPVDPDTVL